MGGSAESPILIDQEENKENPAPGPATPVSERPSLLHVLMRSRPFGTIIETVPDYVYRNLFGISYSFIPVCIYINKNYN